MSPGWFRDWERDVEAHEKRLVEMAEWIAENCPETCGGCLNCWGMDPPGGEVIGLNDVRAQAFGAIRRAAEVARGYERHHDGGFIEYVTALRIRQAIRAAIGSPKA